VAEKDFLAILLNLQKLVFVIAGPIRLWFHHSREIEKKRGHPPAVQFLDGVWRVDYEKPMRTGHKQGEMQLNCFYL
jgi:hypothetical protein